MLLNKIAVTVASDMAENFNPRPREEGDKAAFVIVIFHPHFNPRPREEGDVQMRSERVRLDISIHALVKRATALS